MAQQLSSTLNSLNWKATLANRRKEVLFRKPDYYILDVSKNSANPSLFGEGKGLRRLKAGFLEMPSKVKH
jgi:hypothetical protein